MIRNRASRSSSKVVLSLLILVPVTGVAGGSALAADARRGEELFAHCAACHAVGPAAEKLPGPHLVAIVGRRAGEDDSFADYSPAMRAAGAAGLAWRQEALLAYLEDPQAIVPGTFMTRPPLRNDAEREDIIAYLQTIGR